MFPSTSSAVLLLVAAIASTPDAAPVPVLRGRVFAADGRPARGATVLVLPSGLDASERHLRPEDWQSPRVVRTDDDGAFAVEAAAAGSFAVRAQVRGSAPFTATEVPAGASLTLRLTHGRTIRGRVLGSPEGGPVAGARVVACDAGAARFGRSACSSIEAEEDGHFAFEALAPDRIELRGSAPRRAVSDVARIAAGTGEARVPTLYLRPGAWVSGRVVDQSERPLPLARIVATRALAPPRQAAEATGWPEFTDASGRFLLRGVEKSDAVWIVAERGDRPAAAAGPFRIEAASERSDIEIVLPAAARLALRLVDVDDRPVESVELALSPRGARGPGARGRFVDPSRIEHLDDGRFEVGLLGAGEFDLHVAPVGYRDIERDALELRAGETTDLGTLVADPGRTVEGGVADHDGRPIANATVEASYSAGGFVGGRSERSDAAGRYRLAGLPDRALTLTADAEGFAPSAPREVDVSAVVADFVLEPAAIVTGEVRLEGGGAPESFEITVHREVSSGPGRRDAFGPDGSAPYESRSHARGFSGTGGAYRIDDLEPGRYTLEARVRGWAPGRAPSVALAGGEELRAPTIELKRGATLRGRVLTAPDEAPLPAARVEVREATGWIDEGGGALDEATTDAAGSFEISGLAAGDYTVRATHPDFADDEARTRTDGEATPEIVLLLTRGGTLRGVVRDRDGRAAPGRTILIDGEPTGTERSRRAATGSTGSYEIDRLREGSYRVRLMPLPGSGATAVAWRTAVISEGEITVVDFDEDTGIHLGGVVRGEDGPLGAVTLFFAPDRGGVDLSDFQVAVAEADGSYEVVLDRPGFYRVIVDSGGAPGGGGSTRIEVPDEPRVLRDIELESTGIAGAIVDVEGGPVAGATVTATLAGEAQDLGSLLVAESDARGHYAIRGLAAGSYRVTAIAPGFRAGVADAVELGEGAAVPVDFRLEPGSTLRGHVVGADGRPLAGAVVFAAPAGAGESFAAANTETDVQGAFVLTAPADGPVDLAAFAAGQAPARLDGVLPATDAGDADLVLRASPGGRLLVRVAGAEREPRAGAALSVRAVPGFPGSVFFELLQPALPTDSSGTSLVEHLAPGTYEIRLRDLSAPPRRVVVTEGSETSIVIETRD